MLLLQGRVKGTCPAALGRGSAAAKHFAASVAVGHMLSVTGILSAIQRILMQAGEHSPLCTATLLASFNRRFPTSLVSCCSSRWHTVASGRVGGGGGTRRPSLDGRRKEARDIGHTIHYGCRQAYSLDC